MTSILNHVPAGITPEPAQVRMLQEYERLPDAVRVVCIDAPVASGKMWLGATIASYEAEKHDAASTVVNLDNVLHGEWADECKKMGFHFHEAPYRKGKSEKMWMEAKEAWAKAPLRLANLYSYLALRSYSRALCCDEAHKLVEALQDAEGIKIWKHLSHYPDNVTSIMDVLRWAASAEETAELKKLKGLLKNGIEQYTMDIAVENYRHNDQERIRVYPLTPRNNKPIFWPPSKVKRMVLLSATLSAEDLYDLGLDRFYTAWLRCESRIPPEQRPALYDPVANMSFYGQAAGIPKLVEAMREAADRHEGERGMVHVTYGLGARLARFFEDDPRFIFHNKWNKKAKFKEWQEGDGKVFVAAGFAEGINLKYDKCRWQGIAKILWPNKADPAVAAKLEQRPNWYGWAAMKTLMQQYGRVCRQPDDFGITYIWTSEFETLLKKYRGFAASWFMEALR